MMPTDRDLAASQLSGAALAVALAVRALEAEGQRVTVEQIMALTGYGKTAVYDARAALRRRWPSEYAPRRDSAEPDSAEPDPPAMRKSPGQAPLLGSVELVTQTTAAPAAISGTAEVAPWQRALAAVLAPYDGRRSWDVYAIYSQAWQRVLDDIPEAGDASHARTMGNLIALTADMIERLVDAPCDRGAVAKLVRQYGKAALYGLHQALGATETDETRDLYRYARVVAARTVAELEDA